MISSLLSTAGYQQRVLLVELFLGGMLDGGFRALCSHEVMSTACAADITLFWRDGNNGDTFSPTQSFDVMRREDCVCEMYASETFGKQHANT
jgi:hypothetical protein